MSQISEYVDRVNAKFDEIGASVDGIVTSVTGVSGDVDFLKKTIADLQASAGKVTPEDQALLDALEARVGGMSTRVSGVKDALATLDAATEEPPTPPTT